MNPLRSRTLLDAPAVPLVYCLQRMHSLQVIPHIIFAIRITGSNPGSGVCAGRDA